jgi:cyclopropane fatty-acyl-phospholipid synthase-like methyltransferase
MNTAAQLYNLQASAWARSEPEILSDFTARPRVFELAGDLTNRHVLDLGCGEGYVSRQLKMQHAESVIGIDVSANMIDLARKSANAENMHYYCVNVLEAEVYKPETFDLVVAVFLFNYLSLEQTGELLNRIYSTLKPGARLIFTIPHPCKPFMAKHEFPFYFKTTGNYYESRNSLFKGKIWKFNGESVEVSCIHKTLGDYFKLLFDAGFSKFPLVEELFADSDLVKSNAAFFGPVEGLPLHMLFCLEK